MAEQNNAALPPNWWMKSASDGKVYGPAAPGELLKWARECRIFPDDQISSDQTHWRHAREAPFLAMNTIIVRPDGRVLGPFHAQGVSVLSASGQIPEGSRIVTAEELASGAAAAPRAESAPSGAADGLDAAAIAEEFEEKDARIRELAEELSGKEDRIAELSAQVADRDVRLAGLADALAELESAKARLAEQETLLASYAADSAARESLSAELEAAKVQIASLNEQLASSAADASALTALTAELDAAKEQIAGLSGRLAESDGAHAAALAAAGAELEDARAKAAGLEERLAAAAGEAAAAAGNAEALGRANAELSEKAAAAVSRADGLEKTVAALKCELAGEKEAKDGALAAAETAKAALAALEAEHAELLVFSNSRDAESAEKIASLEKEISELRAVDGGAGQILPTDYAGEARRVKELESELAALMRERADLADRLAQAQSELAAAAHPSDGEVDMIRDFGDEAMNALTRELAREKSVNETARAASLERQRELHDAIENLGRALRRDIGGKSRSELAEERSEKELAKLRREMSAMQERHRAELDRASETEHVLDQRVQALLKHENDLREQLRAAESGSKNAAAFESRLRDRETQIVEAERQFSEERNNWQFLEKTLRARIAELEAGAGSLF